MERCWFCQEPLNRRPNGAPVEAIDQHHRIARRYFRNKAEARQDNLVWVHTGCHRAFNRRYEDPSLSFEQYMEAMEKIAFGKGIFAQPSALAAD